MEILQQLVNGIALGSTYALVALGFSMVYGLLFFINLPHGEVMMVGAYLALGGIVIGLPPVLAVPAAMLLTAALGVVVERLAYRRLRRARRLAPVLSALGLVLVLQNGVRLLVGPQTLSFPPILGSQSLQLAGLHVTSSALWTIVIAGVLLLALELFARRTDVGIAIRGASEDPVGAILMGINPDRIVAVAFAVGSGLAAVAGVLLAARYGSVSPFMGFPVMLKAFAACVLGGIGNLRGAVIGAMVIGLAEVLAGAYLGGIYQDVMAFTVLVVALLLWPAGLLRGRSETAV
ncbi:MAG: branched-chain amino acid ABC transporter permease [Dongiaceae bacterium]